MIGTNATLLRFHLRSISRSQVSSFSICAAGSIPMQYVCNSLPTESNDKKNKCHSYILSQRLDAIKPVISRGFHSSRIRNALPEHKVVPMPSLSPTMEMGSIAKWNLKEGDRFEAGTAICEVETDKATVTYDATEEGYIAKILVGAGEVKVGQPLMVTVEDAADVAAFKDFTPDASPAAASSKPAAAVEPPKAASESLKSVQVNASPAAQVAHGARVFASPLARQLAKQKNVNLNEIQGSGPNGRIVAIDISKLTPKISTPPSSAAIQTTTTQSKAVEINTAFLSDAIYQDFSVTESHRDLANRFAHAKQIVPHYYLSVDLNLKKLLQLRDDLNAKTKGNLSLLDLLLKATALAVKQVPDVNGSWFETFVRRYEQVDINLVIGSGKSLVAPVIRDVNGKGLVDISKEISSIEEDYSKIDPASIALGTITVHNLGMFGIKSAAPIVIPPQACAIAFGTVSEQVIPNPNPKDDSNWTIAPVMTATMSCDHRVVDGAVSAQYLQAIKTIIEEPITLIL